MNYLAAVLNYYECPNDREKWVELWDCPCDAPCPKCSAAIEPFLSVTCKELEDRLSVASGARG